MDDSGHGMGESNARTNSTGISIDPVVWRNLNSRDLATILDGFMTRFGLYADDIAELVQVEPSFLWSAVRQGQFTPNHVTKLLVGVQKRQGIPRGEYYAWRKGLYLAAFLGYKFHTSLEKRQFIWDTRLMKGLYQAISQAYDETNGFAACFNLSLADFAKAWEEEWAWITVPKRYRVTRVEEHGYDLESTLPLAIRIGKIHDVGLGLRAESKGWGTGAYRVYRIKAGPLGNPQDFEPELVHIPAGEFWMCKRVQKTVGTECDREEPSHRVHLDEYWIGRYPVTVAQFAFFVDHHGYFTTEEEKYGNRWHNWRQPKHGEHRDIKEYGQHPVTMVSKADAQAYCRWLSEVTGKAYDLPTQEHWEKAMRGTDARRYPWGDNEPNRKLCNIENWFGGTTPVGHFGPDGDGPKFDNKRGCADLVGNVSEWTLDTRTVTGAVHPDCDPNFYYYKTRTYRVTCGASWRTKGQVDRQDHTYNAVRDDVGFRVIAHPSAEVGSTSH